MKKKTPTRFARVEKKAPVKPANKSSEKAAFNGLYIDKRVLYYVVIPLASLIVIAAFILAGFVIGRVTAEKAAASAEKTAVVETTPTPSPTPTITPTPSPTPTETPSPTPSPTATETSETNYYGRLGGTNDGGANYVGRITFIGGEAANKLNFYYDSVTDENTWYAPSNHGAILEQLEVEVNGTEMLLPEAVGYAKPDILVLAFCGINFGSRSWETEKFVSEYETLIETLKQNASSETDFVIMSLFPITQAYEDTDTHYNQTNARISEINRKLEIYAYNNECYYLDVNGVLRGSDGALKEEFWSDETAILNREGYRTVYNYLKTHQVLH